LPLRINFWKESWILSLWRIKGKWIFTSP